MRFVTLEKERGDATRFAIAEFLFRAASAYEQGLLNWWRFEFEVVNQCLNAGSIIHLPFSWVEPRQHHAGLAFAHLHAWCLGPLDCRFCG